MAADPPLVSICLPAYNGERTIERALQSLADQTYPNIELFVSDDASTDATAKICERYARLYPIVHFSRNPENLGAQGNLRSILNRTSGEYFVWASQDDYWDPDFVSTLVDELERCPEAVIAQGACKRVRDDEEIVDTIRLLGADTPQDLSILANAISIIRKRGKTTKGTLKNNLFIHGVIRRKHFVAALDAFPGVFSTDRLIVCQLALAGKFVYVDQVLFEKMVYRVTLSERRPPKDTTLLAKRRPFPRIRYAYGLIVSIIRSEIVPWHRKLSHLPVVLLVWFWYGTVLRTYYGALAVLRDRLPRRLFEALRRLRGYARGRTEV